jgi:3-hydroxyacyl-CoA dehydrogenase
MHGAAGHCHLAAQPAVQLILTTVSSGSPENNKPEESKMVDIVFKNVAVIGTGVIGRGWIRVFTRAGCRTRIYDADPAQTHKTLAWVESDLECDAADGLISPQQAQKCLSLISLHTNLDEAIAGAEYVQECGPEQLEIKHSIFSRMDEIAAPGVILASSTSALDIEDIAGGLRGAGRCITAHPFNPPHILPAVEMMFTKGHDPVLFEQAVEFLKSVGQKPVRMNFFIPGYLANRIQAAVVREAIHLVQCGVASVEAIDTVISEALGLRWAVFGNFGTNNTNADGGVREYYSRFGQSYISLMKELDPTPPSFDAQMIEQIGQGVDAMEGDAPISEICRWRDRMVLKIRKLKEQDPHP